MSDVLARSRPLGRKLGRERTFEKQSSSYPNFPPEPADLSMEVPSSTSGACSSFGSDSVYE